MNRLDELERALYEDPENKNALIEFAELMSDEGKPAFAHMALKAAINGDRGWNENRAVGGIELNLQRYDKAESYLLDAHAQNPPDRDWETQ